MRVAFLCLGVWLLSASMTPLAAQSLQAGQGLFENHCMDCHHPALLEREARKVSDYEALSAETLRWGRELQLNWSAEDYRSVIHYLDARYYQFRAYPEPTPQQ